MIISCKYLVPKGYAGLTIFPFVFLRHKDFKENNVLLNHEKIHLKQQLEFLIIPFFVWYGIEFLLRFMQYRNWHLAYKNICFEREAFGNESNLKYVNQRRFWQFLKYLRSDEHAVK